MGSNGILAFGAPLPNGRRKANLGSTNGTDTPPGRDLMVKSKFLMTLFVRNQF